MTAENENKSTTSASGLSQSKTRLRLIDYYWVVICKNHRVHHKGNTSLRASHSARGTSITVR